VLAASQTFEALGVMGTERGDRNISG